MNRKLQLLALAITTTFIANAQVSSTCKNVCDKIRIVESGPFIGIRFNTIPNTNTVRILEVIPNTAAQRSGFAVNDVITSFENIAIANNQQLLAAVAAHQPGDKVAISYLHNNKMVNQEITIGAKFTKEVIEKVCCDEPIVTNAATAISVSPNPATNKIILRSNVKIDGDIDIKIVDIKGVTVKTLHHTNRGMLVLPIDVTELMSGNYFVKMQTIDKQFVEQLAIAK
jgi:PDZ domain/Secretion system C-terminal sorting domain